MAGNRDQKLDMYRRNKIILYSQAYKSMSCKWSKPGACHHLSFTINPVLSNFIGKIHFFEQFHIFVPNYSEGVENETNLA